MSDAIYQSLRKDSDPLSVHLADYPKHSQAMRDIQLEEEMDYVQKVVSLGHALRKEHKIKVRQPLQVAYIISTNRNVLESLKGQKGLIEDELNVKDVAFQSDESKFVRLSAKANFRVLGKKVGKLMPKVQKQIQDLDLDSIKALEKGEKVEIQLEGESFYSRYRRCVDCSRSKRGLSC